jgi:hypothetical protein
VILVLPPGALKKNKLSLSSMARRTFSLKWHLQAFGLLGGLVFGLVFGLLGGLVFGLVFGLLGGLVGWPLVSRPLSPAQQRVARYRTRVELSRRRSPYRYEYPVKIWLSLLILWLALLLIGMLTIVLEKGPIGWLVEVVRYYTLRFWLARSGVFPWRAVPFLEDATARILLRRVGGGYSFVHRLLLDFFADAYEEH